MLSATTALGRRATRCGVAQHAALLASRGVTHATLPELTASSFVGISGLMLADRRKLVAAARALREEAV